MRRARSPMTGNASTAVREMNIPVLRVAKHPPSGGSERPVAPPSSRVNLADLPDCQGASASPVLERSALTVRLELLPLVASRQSNQLVGDPELRLVVTAPASGSRPESEQTEHQDRACCAVEPDGVVG
jgi:hypothetical protein